MRRALIAVLLIAACKTLPTPRPPEPVDVCSYAPCSDAGALLESDGPWRTDGGFAR